MIELLAALAKVVLTLYLVHLTLDTGEAYWAVFAVGLMLDARLETVVTRLDQVLTLERRRSH